MDIPESQWPIVWRAIEIWRKAKRLGKDHFSLLTAGMTKESYPPDRIARGIKYGTERITRDLLRASVIIFGLVSARQWDPEDISKDEEVEYVSLLTAPLRDTTEQGKFQL